MTSMFVPVLVCAATGETAATCGSLRRTSAILTDTGDPVIPEMKDDPGGRTKMSAPVPLVRCLLSFKMPSDNPTISRMSVTSTAMATTLIRVRMGRWTRLERINFFICEYQVLSTESNSTCRANWDLSGRASCRDEALAAYLCPSGLAPAALPAEGRGAQLQNPRVAAGRISRCRAVR